MLNRIQLTAAAALLIAGCNSSAPQSGGPSPATDDAAGPRNVTFFVAGMNQQLQIL